MTSPPSSPPRPNPLIQTRLIQMAAAFVILYAVLLTLAPAVRSRSWNLNLNVWIWASVAVWLVGMILLVRQANRHAPGADPFLLPLVALLSGWGLLEITRLSPALGLRQTIWLGLGWLLMWVGFRLRAGLTYLRRYKYIWLTLGLLVTALTLIFGTYPGGTGPHLWLGCCGVYFQPSEPLKLLLIIYLAAYLADRLPISLSIFGMLAPTLILIALALMLLVVQRDLGTATLLILIYTLTLYLSSGRRRMLLLSFAALLGAGFIGYTFSAVVHNRVDAWLNPWLDPSGGSYQIVQSLIALASGGLIGRGPGLGNPGIVPVAVSDFIYPAIVEETGLLGGLGLLLAYVLLITRGLTIALRAPLNYHRYLAAGISAYFACQTILIVAGNIRVMPLTGVTLPFISYGGSSLITSFAAVLILLLISRQSDQDPAPLVHAQPYNIFYTATALGFTALALVTGWYAIVRQENLLTRADNPRRSVDDRYVQRGALLDRHNRPISHSSGSPGSYMRIYDYPDLILTSGYSDPVYGQSGLEASQDSYLRGLQGNPTFTIWWNRLLYGQPPAGLDVRLSIDLDLQTLIDQGFQGHRGAAVLLNAKTGEVLAMASHPNFDPAQLSVHWEELVASTDAPLLNRATQGLYSPGPAIAPVILSESLTTSLPDLPEQMNYTLPDDTLLTCALTPADSQSWGSVLSSGCPGPLAVLGSRFLSIRMDNLFNRFDLADSPLTPLHSAQPILPAVTKPDLAGIGEMGMQISPLQMALIAATISNHGVMSSPLLPVAVDTPSADWVVLSTQDSHSILTSTVAGDVSQLLAQPGKLYWQVVAVANSNQAPITWFVGGTIDEWKGSPMAIAIVLEEDNPQLAQTIGDEIILAALNTR